MGWGPNCSCGPGFVSPENTHVLLRGNWRRDANPNNFCTQNNHVVPTATSSHSVSPLLRSLFKHIDFTPLFFSPRNLFLTAEEARASPTHPRCDTGWPLRSKHCGRYKHGRTGADWSPTMVPTNRSYFWWDLCVEVAYGAAIYPPPRCLRGGGADLDLHTRCVPALLCVCRA